MPKKIGILLATIGAVLILSALLLFLHNEREDRRAGQEAELLLVEIQSVMKEQQPKETLPDPTEGENQIILDPKLPTVMIDGFAYVGYLTIQNLELTLPVMAEADYDRLEIAPCRQWGSSRTDDLVIAAHNYDSHFGKLSKLEIGSQIQFTDMDGIENHYRLAAIETLPAQAVEEILSSGYPLVLYTCTPGGSTRVAAFCQRE